jgi:hypothetical protein
MKIHQQPFDDLVSGRKTGEVRNCADREFREGDVVELFLIDETGQNPANKSIVRVITHIQRGYGLPDDICVLSYATPVVERQPVAEVSVDRELLVVANVCVMRTHDLLAEQMKSTDHKEEYRAEIARLKDAHEKIKRAFLPTSFVEFQPAAYVLTSGGEVCYESDDGIVISNTDGDETDLLKWKAVYFAPPELAELQATIAQQAAEIERLKSGLK